MVEAAPDERFDLVIRDAFDIDHTPKHLTTVSFLTHCRRVLRPGGLYLANCADSTALQLARRELASAAAVFDQVAVIAETGQLRGRRFGTVVIVGGQDNLRQTAIRLDHTLRALAVPARILDDAQARAWAGGAQPFND
jgi:spermidine synthase